MVHSPAPNVSAAAQAAFSKKHTSIISTTVGRLLLEPGAFDHLGDQAERILSIGFEFTTATLEACMAVNNADLFLEQLRWSQDRLPHDGIQMERMAKNLDVYCEVIAELLPPAYAVEITGMVDQVRAAHAVLNESIEVKYLSGSSEVDR